MRTIFTSCFVILYTFCNSQTEIKPVISETDSIKKPLNQISFNFINGGCIGREDKVVLIRTQEEMESFNSHYKDRTSSCTEVTSKKDFKSQEVLFVGMSLGGNEKLQVNFSFVNETLVIILTVISPENVDDSYNLQAKYFFVDKKYLQNMPVCRLDHKMIR